MFDNYVNFQKKKLKIFNICMMDALKLILNLKKIKIFYVCTIDVLKFILN